MVHYYQSSLGLVNPYRDLSSSKNIHVQKTELTCRFAKYFGSGVIIATAFIHLLAPAFEELGSECLSGAWTDYSWAPAIAMAAVYGIFFAEVAAYRVGSKKLAKLGVHYSEPTDSPCPCLIADQQTHTTRDLRMLMNMPTPMAITLTLTEALPPKLPTSPLDPGLAKRRNTPTLRI